jgi:hypothetical protein
VLAALNRAVPRLIPLVLHPNFRVVVLDVHHVRILARTRSLVISNARFRKKLILTPARARRRGVRARDVLENHPTLRVEIELHPERGVDDDDRALGCEDF